MKSMTTIFFLLSVFLLFGAVRYLIALRRPGVYPPKQVLKQRAGTLAAAGGISLLIAVILNNL